MVGVVLDKDGSAYYSRAAGAFVDRMKAFIKKGVGFRLPFCHETVKSVVGGRGMVYEEPCNSEY